MNKCSGGDVLVDGSGDGCGDSGDSGGIGGGDGCSSGDGGSNSECDVLKTIEIVLRQHLDTIL